MILNLKDAGDTATLTIRECEVVPDNFDGKVKFISNNGYTILVPKKSVERQLDRIGVAEISEIAGRELTFSRAQNHKSPSKPPFWNIDKARPEDVRTPPTDGVPPNGKPPIAQQPDRVVNPNAKTVPGGLDETETGAPPEDALSPLEAKRKAISEAHGRAFAYVCKNYVPMAAEHGVDLSLEGVSALTFQLFKAQEDVR